MAKIRTIKPELFRHEALFEAEKISNLPLRLTFMGLFTCCDREGRFRWRPKPLKLDILPYDEINFPEVLNTLLAYGFVGKYRVGNEWYGYIPSWQKHQHINNREALSYLPSPEEAGKENFSSIERCENPEVTPATDTHEDDVSKKSQESSKILLLQNSETKNKGVLSRDFLVIEIFQFWQKTLNHPLAILDNKRKRCISAALTCGYNFTQLCEAIQGCALTPHNMGKNERGERYDGLHIIFKNADNIERFIRNYHHPPANTVFPPLSKDTHSKARLSHEHFDNKQYTQTPIEHISWMQSG